MSKKSNFIDLTINITLVVLVLTIGISYHPTIVNMSRMAGLESGTILSRYIVLLFVGIFVLSLFSKGFAFIRSNIIRTILIWMLIIGAVGMLALALFDNSEMLGDLRSLIVVFGTMVIGWNLRITRKFLYVLFFSFAISVFYSGLMQIIINIGGFVIEDLYLTNAKNALGALLASATLTLLFISQDTKARQFRFLSIAGVVFGLFLLLVIRARMAFLTSGALIVYYYYLRSRSNKFIFVAALLLVALFIVYPLLPNSAFDFISASMTAGTQGEDITSGRLDSYFDALAIFAEDPLFANINHSEQIGWVHNFPLLKLSSYGLLFSWPILILYCFVFWKALTNSYRFHGEISFFNLFLLVPFIISMAEPTFPFGPGTVTVFNFLLFGMADRAIATKTPLIFEN